jgi:exodeoxyribonuclease-1
MVVPVARDPGNPNAIWVYDLRQDPEPFMGLDARTLADRIFTSHTELDAQNLERLPVKAVHANRCPVLAPVKTLDDAARERLQLDETQCLKHLEILRSWEELETLLPEALQFSEWPEPFDPEQSLYSGPFFSNADRQIMQRVLISRPEELGQQHFVFEDRRLPEMLFRYRARNYPDTLTRDEKADWNEYREYRLTSDEGGANITLPAYFEKINQLRDEYADDPDRLDVLRSLEEYGNTMKQGFS